ncbi:hypothetical protein [Salinibacter sp.]|uniref:hypothetical protein n=1 Tax=Salinibacter sp. TaxID=2065818 RepID=UPI0021E80F83|nr:hypothetical protein [Salinibacter sp.]
MSRIFYILADQPKDGIYSADTLCKFGVTTDSVSKRRNVHESRIAERGRLVQFERYFEATGSITSKERCIRRLTKHQAIDEFASGHEWRKCNPKKLAELAMEIADEGAGTYEVHFIRNSRHPKASSRIEVPLNVRIPRKMRERLRAISEKTGRTVCELVMEGLKKYIGQ